MMKTNNNNFNYLAQLFTAVAIFSFLLAQLAGVMAQEGNTSKKVWALAFALVAVMVYVVIVSVQRFVTDVPSFFRQGLGPKTEFMLALSVCVLFVVHTLYGLVDGSMNPIFGAVMLSVTFAAGFFWVKSRFREEIR